MYQNIDIHNMTVAEAKKKIQQLIVNNPQCTQIIVTHGYNSGNELARLILDNRGKRLGSKRIIRTEVDGLNQGVSYIHLRKK